ncbi:MAG TPA: glycosyltransferase family 2 protein [bacterium]|nr:glycosyltransferase family 2 protein [bacterium]
MTTDYLKIGRASELTGRDHALYRFLEILPGLLSWSTLLVLIILSYFQPVWVAMFVIAFDVYWLLLVIYLAIILISAYRQITHNLRVDWRAQCLALPPVDLVYTPLEGEPVVSVGVKWSDLYHLVIFPCYNEGYNIIQPSIEALIKSSFPRDKMIVILAIEERGGPAIQAVAERLRQEYENSFFRFRVIVHPDNLVGELKGKGANQAWAAKKAKEEIIDPLGLDYNLILASVFDSDTVIYENYFYCLSHKFLTTKKPYRHSYQPIPMYHNNIWQAPFFARVAAYSNTFWQMMQQIRQEKLATYSSHSMPWRALVEIGFWSTKMVSEDSRIFWHCFCYYRGDYEVEPLYYPVSMDVCMDETAWQTARNLYKQQRRWGWGVENVPYLMFNTIKSWRVIPRKLFLDKIFIQIYGFHSWATNAIIIGCIGWLPLFLGSDRFNQTVLSNNLPNVTRILMTIAMVGMVLSAIISSLLLPPRPVKTPWWRRLGMIAQWIFLPVTIVVFGAIPGLEAQTRLMLGKYMGFWVTPKARSG